MVTTPRKQPTSKPTISPAQANLEHLELLGEVRVLTREVGKLHNIFVKRTVLWWVLGIETFLVVGALIGVFVLSAINHADTNRLINRFQDSCHVRNKQINGTTRFITETQSIQTDSQKITGELLAQLHVTLTPAQIKEFAAIQKRYNDSLQHYRKSQPKPLACKVNGG